MRRIVSTACCSTGQGKQFQPNKPLTKAQEELALMSGKMAEAIHAELSRLEVGNSLRQTAMEDIRSAILNKGDIHRY
ncbi:tRNA(adenine(34)) deaminase [Sarracenia purpurea var. burkii]